MPIDNVSRIKEKLGIVEVVSDYVKLEKAGANLKGKCPFHNEKTASFFVSPERGSYKCFGCGASGDIFTFVEQFEGVDFKGSLKILAEKAGIELVREDPKIKDKKEKLFKIMEEATLFFEKNLSENESAKNYLKERGLKKDTVKQFRIGFSKNGWTFLLDRLKEKGYSEKDIEAVGLIKKKEKGGNFYDRFRGRIMFPIFDNSGRVIAFSGRLFENNSEYEQAKYLNSPEMVLFHKSNILFGYNFAKNNIRKRGFSILVEGQMDIFMSHQAGFTNTVASSGTALTTEHLNLLKRLSDKIIMAFDSDKAGLNAANKGAGLALEMEMDVKFVEIPEGLDPADFILKDEKGWILALKNSVQIIDFNLNILLNRNLEKRVLGTKIKEIILPLISKIKSKIDQDYFVSKISAKTGIAENAIWEDLEKIEIIDDENNFEKDVVNKDKKRQEELSLKKKALREISGIYYWQKSLKKNFLDIKKIEEKLKEILNEDIFLNIKNLSNNLKNEIIFEAENLYIDEKTLKKKLDELFLNLEKECLKEKAEKIQEKINRGEDDEENLKKYNELLKKIKK